jgi:hypothetical protein
MELLYYLFLKLKNINMKTRTLHFTKWSTLKPFMERLQRLYGAVINKLRFDGNKFIVTYSY